LEWILSFLESLPFRKEKDKYLMPKNIV